jgi:hypothetical protein
MGYNVDHISTTPSGTWAGNAATDVDNIRRTFGISDNVAQLAPAESIFFSYLSKLGKKTTDDTVWKPLEYRNQWQRRNFNVAGRVIANDGAGAITANAVTGDAGTLTHLQFWCDYDRTGQITKSAVLPEADSYVQFAPIFLVENQIVRLNGEAYKLTAEPDIVTWTAATTASHSGVKGGAKTYATIPIANVVKVSNQTAIAASDALWDTDGATYQGQVIGSQWGEGTGAPEGWRDELSSVEFFTQIFKTSVPLMSGSAQATKYRGFSNEFKRIYAEHIKSHKMDLENAFLFGYGQYASANARNSWGMIPFIENKGGKRYQLDYDTNAAATSDGTYDVKAGFSYDGMIDVMDDFMNWEGGNSGQKLCLTSRKVINALHRVGDGNFLSNSFSNAAGDAAGRTAGLFEGQLKVKSSSFMPIDITSISTSWGSMNFVAHPLFRGDMADKAVCIDLSNVSMRPLSANGVSRDTFVETNIQANDVDGRKDQIITEAGLEVMLPETHAVIDFV